MRKLILALLAAVLLFSCNNEGKTRKIGEEYLQIFSQRKELDRILSFYSNDFVYRNVSFDSETDDPKFLFEQLYGWKDPGFKYSGTESIEVLQIVDNDTAIVVKGRSLPYSYNGREVKGNDFVIWLDLDKNHKIKRQTDWYDYPMEELIEAYRLKNSFKIQ